MAYIPDEAILRWNELSSGALGLYCVLCRHRNSKTGQCNPSITLCDKTLGISDKGTYRLRRELVEKDWARFDGDNVIWLRFFNPDPPPPPAADRGTVYVVSDGRGHFKIGKTTNLEKRIQGLSCGLPFDLIVVHRYQTLTMSKEEARWHAFFSEKRVRGEWFLLSEQDIELIKASGNSVMDSNENDISGAISATGGEENATGSDIPVTESGESETRSKELIHVSPEPAKEPANRTSKGEPTRASAPAPYPDASGLEPLIAILADHYKLYVEPNRRWYEQAARAVLARHQGEAAAERLSAFLRAKPGQKLTFFATDFASWDAGTAKLRAAAGIGSYSPDFDIAPGMEILDGLSEDELEVLRAKVLSSPTCLRFDQWEPDKAEAYLRIEMAAIAKQEAVTA